MVVFPNSSLPKVDIKPLSSRRLLMLNPSFAQTTKNYKYINAIIHTGTTLLEAAFLPTHPDTTQWSRTCHVNIDTINPNAAVNTQTDACLSYHINNGIEDPHC